MKKVNISLFYNFARGFYELKLLNEGDSLSHREVLRIVLAAKIWIRFFLAETTEIAFLHTRKIAEQIGDLLEEETSKIDKDDTQNKQEDKGFSNLFIQRVSELLDEFERFLSRESQTVSIFTVTKKGIYEIDSLIERAEQRFPESIRKHFPDTTIYDFREAGKCLAFECPTAMAFHVLRSCLKTQDKG